MTDAYVTSIDGLGPKRAKILAEKLGIRSVEALHASAVDEIVAAIDSAGSRATTDEVEAWLQAAREELKAETVGDWDSLVRSARVSQTTNGSTRTVDVGVAPSLPLSSAHSFLIELDLTSSSKETVEFEFKPIGTNKDVVVLYRQDTTTGEHRWLVPKAARGLYRLGVRATDGSMVSGPIVQTV